MTQPNIQLVEIALNPLTDGGYGPRNVPLEMRGLLNFAAGGMGLTDAFEERSRKILGRKILLDAICRQG